MSLFHYYDLSYSEVFVFDDYLINQIREGETISTSHNLMLKEIISKHFKDKNLVYISNREKEYFVNPLIYKEVEKIPNLLAMVIVSEVKFSKQKIEEEFKLYSKPYKITNSLTEAVVWADRFIKN